MLTHIKIQTKIALCFSAIIFVIGVFSIFMLFEAYAIQRLSESISNISTPTVQTSSKMSNAVNSALASLRGWIITGEDQQKENRKKAWISIREAESEMENLNLIWNNSENTNRFNQIQSSLDQFELHQIKIENIAQKPFNTPATNILLTIGSPMAQSMFIHISRMINLEKNKPQTEKRKKLLLAMSNTRGSYSYELASIRAYLLSANSKFKKEYKKQKNENAHAFLTLKKLHNIMTDEQKSHFKEFSVLKQKFDQLPKRIFSIRDRPDWNRASYHLKKDAAPLGNEILKLLSEMITSQNQKLVIDGKIITSRSQAYVIELLELSIVVTLLAIFIGIFIGRNIANDLKRAVKISNKIAADDFDLNFMNLDKNNKSEIGELMNSLYTMANELALKKLKLNESQFQIIQANKLAAIGEMAANIAHEINSPLQTISIYTYKLKKMSKELNQISSNECLDKIDYSVDKVTAIIESLLKLSRNPGNEQLDNSPIGDIINDVLEVCEERFKLSDIRLDVEYHNESKHSKILGQYTSLTQVITNLLNNAYDAVISLEDKWVSIDIKDTDDTIEIAVMDSGNGIPIELQDKIFQAMFTSKDVGQGTGIGLSISAEIIRQHRGTITLDVTSKNTRFVVILPKNCETQDY